MWRVYQIGWLTADLQREMMGLQREEQKLITDIKKAAKQNNTQATRVLAKSLVRLRGQMNQLRASEAQLRGVKTTVTVIPLKILSQIRSIFGADKLHVACVFA